MERCDGIGTRWSHRRGEWCGFGWALRCKRAQPLTQCVFGLRHALACGR